MTDDSREDVVRLLERLTDCDEVEAVSRDMSESFRGAVQLCLPRARIVADLRLLSVPSCLIAHLGI